MNYMKNTPLAQIARELNTDEGGARIFAQRIFKESEVVASFIPSLPFLNSYYGLCFKGDNRRVAK
jgi:hypothetical protein